MNLEKPTAKNKNQICTAKFTIEAGALLRGQIRRLLKERQFQNSHVEVTWEEDKGFLDSAFFIKFSGKYYWVYYEVESWKAAIEPLIGE